MVVHKIALIKGALELDGARTEQIFRKKFAYPLRRAILWTTKNQITTFLLFLKERKYFFIF